MRDTKLRLEDLTSEERAIVDGIYLILRSNCTNGTEAERYADAVRQSCDAILARRALFAPAPSEAAKVVCPNCGEEIDRTRRTLDHLHPESDKHGLGPFYVCQPAQPEPAAPEMPPMPNAVHNLVLWCQMLSASQYGQGFRSQIKADLDAFTDWWRTHSQPVAHPFKAGFKPDSMRHFAEYVRDNWHYFGTDTAGLAHQFLQEMAAQPVAVGMSLELETVLLAADVRLSRSYEKGWAWLEENQRDVLRKAIAAVRQQAAQVAK